MLGALRVRIIECEITIITPAGRRTGVYRLATTLLEGCFAVVAGGALAGADTAHDRRPAIVVVGDRNVQLTAFDAINRLRTTLEDHHLAESVRILEPGESIALPAAA